MSIRRTAKSKTRFSWRKFAAKFFESVDSPVSLACHMLLKYGEHAQLVELDVDPLNYTSASDFFMDYQCVKLLSKSSLLDTGINRRTVAMEKFLEAEYSCYLTNTRLSSSHRKANPCPPVVNTVFHRAQRKIAAILGDVPELQDLNFRFGPGAAYGVRGETHVYNKLHSELECTLGLVPILGDLFAEHPSWISEETATVAICQGSELTFVPKSAKTDRPICIEPLLNGFVQKGVGSYMRSRLKRWRIDLNDQTVNQKLASIAHVASLCTVDFSSASDTIAYALVLELLPFEWVEFLERSRCENYSFEGNWYAFEKFTSMGNAYTFELESLIFYALATASCEVLGVDYETGTNLSVYGDDVIIPREAFDLFHEVTNFAGFSINTEKTFTSGPFYESCGKDYFLGSLVRPFLIKKDFLILEDVYYVANSISRFIGQLLELADEAPPGRGLDHVLNDLSSLHGWVVSTIPRRLRFLGPEDHGDGHLIAPFDVSVNQRSIKRHRFHDSWVYRTVVYQAKKKSFDETDEVRLIYALYFAGLGTMVSSSARFSTFKRVPSDESEILILGLAAYKAGLVKEFRNVPVELDNSSGYTIRNHTLRRVITSECFGFWPDSPPWGARSVRLVS